MRAAEILSRALRCRRRLRPKVYEGVAWTESRRELKKALLRVHIGVDI